MDKINNPKQNSKLSWFAFHPADFAGETQHLTNVQVGAYFRLVCYYAQTGGLPADDGQLANIARCKSVKEWKAMREVLEPLFDPDGRLATEVNKAHAIREERAAAGRKGGFAKSSKTVALLDVRQVAKLCQPEPEPEPDPEKVVSNKETLSLKGISYSLEGSATGKEEASTGGEGLDQFGGRMSLSGKGRMH